MDLRLEVEKGTVDVDLAAQQRVQNIFQYGPSMLLTCLPVLASFSDITPFTIGSRTFAKFRPFWAVGYARCIRAASSSA